MSDTATYVPFSGGRTGPFQPGLPATLSPSPDLSCEGSPEGVVPGVPGQLCQDIDSDRLYMKMLGTQSVGWILFGKRKANIVSDSGSAGQQVFAATSDPNGVIQATGPAICVGKDTYEGTVWVKSTSGTSATDWVAVILTV